MSNKYGFEKVCSNCKGEGEIFDNVELTYVNCPECNGEGIVNVYAWGSRIVETFGRDDKDLLRYEGISC